MSIVQMSEQYECEVSVDVLDASLKDIEYQPPTYTKPHIPRLIEMRDRLNDVIGKAE